VFKVTSTGKEKTLYSFTGGSDGSEPAAGLIFDDKGNLYGTTEWGGSGYGTVFKITPLGVGIVLYSFTGIADGAWPGAGVVLDEKGNLYGTTLRGGTSNWGTVFKLTPSGKKTVLYSFTGGFEGGYPKGTLIFDSSGNLFGTTFYGGGCLSDCGVVFKITPAGKETVLHAFNGRADGACPSAGVIRDAKGNLYGTTEQGGTYNVGTVFKVTPSGKQTILYSFSGETDGEGPIGGVIRDASGNLYGTTQMSNHFSGYGTVFEVTPSGEEKVLHSFAGGTDGIYPLAGLIFDLKGNLDGTTAEGGSSGYGTVFKVVP
jgi:uncharacterized repeat protein (TIGR03803 family)